jgi:hypothetical protein
LELNAQNNRNVVISSVNGAPLDTVQLASWMISGTSYHPVTLSLDDPVFTHVRLVLPALDVCKPC